MVSLLLGDCLVHMRDMESNSVDSIITDPPYGISFMNKQWDYDIPSVEIWKECLRILKPGGHLLSFGGSRTFHRIAVNIEDAGFDIRDTIMWVYGSGFPKSHNIGNGWGTALKPAHEPIIMARKPFKGTVSNNVLQYGTGAINIDECRVGDDEIKSCGGRKTIATGDERTGKALGIYGQHKPINKTHIGRWPANFIHDGSDEVLDLLPDISSKFFYCAKANKKDRNEGCEDLEEKPAGCMVGNNILARPNHKGLNNGKFVSANNHHPTVKPTELMRYLCRLVTPKNGIVLDPFMGSGSTGKAAILEGFSFIGIEMNEEYFEIAKRRAKDGKQD